MYVPKNCALRIQSGGLMTGRNGSPEHGHLADKASTRLLSYITWLYRPTRSSQVPRECSPVRWLHTIKVFRHGRLRHR